MDAVYKFFAAYSGFILFFGLVSHFIKEKLYLSEVLFACFFGIILKNFIDTKPSEEFIILISRVLMSIQVVAVGMNVPRRYIFREVKSLLVILFPIMIGSFLFSTAVINAIHNFDIRICMMIGAAISPTDPVLASTILKGKFANQYIPLHLRNLLIVESGVNDGLGFPLMAIPVLLIKFTTPKNFLKDFCLKVVFYEVILGIVLGFLIGYSARKLLIFCKNRGFVDKESYLSYLLVLSFFSIGITALLKVDDILALFVVGLTFAWEDSIVQRIRESKLLEIVDLIFSLNFFIFFGSILDFKDFTFKNTIISFLLVFFKRLPFFFAFKRFIPQLFNLKETFFAGWFGPIGVGALFFGYEALHSIPECKIKGVDSLIPIIKCLVFTSVVVHGITAPIVHFHLKSNQKKIEDENFSRDESDYTDDDCEITLDSDLNNRPFRNNTNIVYNQKF